jgi:hypothetical protein
MCENEPTVSSPSRDDGIKRSDDIQGARAGTRGQDCVTQGMSSRWWGIAFEAFIADNESENRRTF